MIADVTAADEIYIVCGYTDYPRRIVIREDFRETIRLNNPIKYFSNNDYSYILIV